MGVGTITNKKARKGVRAIFIYAPQVKSGGQSGLREIFRVQYFSRSKDSVM